MLIMKILITNDDGLHGKGLKPLQISIKSEFSDVMVVVPDRERSAVSQAITLNAPIRMNKIKKNFYTLDGTPTDCVYLTILGAVDYLPDMVISGINRGFNLGEDIIYSGTVAAAIEATLANIKSFAISIDANQKKIYYDSASKFALKFSKFLSKFPLDKGVFFNINLPNIPYNLIKGVKITKLGSRKYIDKLIKRKDPRGGRYFWLQGDKVLWHEEKNTDFYEVHNGFISITPLHLDLTAYNYIKKMKKVIKDVLDL